MMSRRWRSFGLACKPRFPSVAEERQKLRSNQRLPRGFSSLREYIRASPSVDVRVVVRAARVEGRVLHSVRGPTPTPQQVADVFAHFEVSLEAKLIAREIRLQDRMNEALSYVNHAHGPDAVLEVIESGSVARLQDLLRSPAATIVLGWKHVGPPVVLAAAARTLNAARGRTGIVGGLWERQPAAGASRQDLGTALLPSQRIMSDMNRTAGMWQLAQHLKSGGIVGLQANDPKGTTLDVPCLGRSLQFGRGPFALSRLTGAPIVPVMKRWTPSHEVAFVVGPPLQPLEDASHAGDDADRRLAFAAVRWIEARIRETPDALRPTAILGLLSAPLVGSRISTLES